MKNHAFHDANKRTGLLAVLALLHRNKWLITIEQRWLDRLVVAVAEGTLSEFFRALPAGYRKRIRFIDAVNDDERVVSIADFLKRNTRREPALDPIVTFNELNTALKRHGFELLNPNGNFIDVCRLEVPVRNIFGQMRPVKPTKLCQIGFPSWKSKVSRNAIKTVRVATGLTKQNGCDTDALLHGEAPISGLIAEYIEPLKRLANK